MKNNFKISKLIPWIWLMGGYVFDIVFFLSKGKKLIDSDMASEMVLSDLLNKQHAIISHDWAYSTEIKVFEGQWFYRIGLLLSHDNWLVARTIGTAIGMALLLVGWMYLANVLKMKEEGVWIAAFLAWPFGFWYFFDIILGGFYIPHCIMMVFSLGLMISVAKQMKNNSKSWVTNVQTALIIFMGIASGTNSIRQALLFYVPLFVYGIIAMYLQFREHGVAAFRDNNLKRNFTYMSLIGLVANVVGYGINIVFFVNNYKFSSFNEMTWGNGSGSLIETMKWYFNSYGLFDYATKSFFSLSGIGTGCGLILGFIVLFSIIRLVIIYKRLDEEVQIYLGSLLSIFLVVGMVFTYVWGEEQYWCPLVPFGVVSLFAEIKYDPILKDMEKRVLPNIVMLLVLISSVGTVKANIEQPFRANRNFDGALEYIEESGYTSGVASFWMSQCVTELTDGQVEMWTTNDEYTEMLLWLQSNNHRDIPEGKFFGLYNINDQDFADNFEQIYGVKGELAYKDDGYMIYLYEN